MVPPNVRFEIDDFTEPWLFKKDHFDFIHVRSLYGCVADWSTFYKEALEYEQPPCTMTPTPALPLACSTLQG